ncbi:MAG: acyl-CoA dehydrogenase family protein [Actinomycetes bacterium]
MRLRFDDDAEAFRAELDAWLDANAPHEDAQQDIKTSSGHLPQWARDWQRKLYDNGWLVPGWPPELGGRNATPVQTMVYFEELSRRRVPRALNPQGLGIVAPSILDFGTDAQKERYLVPTLRGEITWCLGMSEPDAGSDLAGLRTHAALDGDAWVVNGQKVWTSGAHDANYCFCFVRTEPDAPKHKGISVLIIDMATPGITCRPLPELVDPEYADFNEVFFDNVRVPADALVGERGQGWPIASTSLGHERGMLWIGQQTFLQREVEALIELGRARPEIGTDPSFREAVASLWIDATAMKVMGYRGFAKFAQGRAAPEHSLLKLYGAEARQRLQRVASDALGAQAFDRSALSNVAEVRAHSYGEGYLWSFGQTIAGGTSEIQRNIIAERVLGLPRS